MFPKKNRPSPFRRRTLALAIACGLAPAFTAAANAAPAISKEWVLLVMKVESLEGEARRESTIKAPVHYGKAYRLPMLEKTPQAVLVSVLPRRSANGEINIEAQLSRGEPGIRLSDTRVRLAPGKIARIDVTQPDSPEKLALLLMPITPPASFDPAKEQISLETPWP